MCFFVAVTLTKLSALQGPILRGAAQLIWTGITGILSLYLRIFPESGSISWFRRSVWFVIGMCAAYGVAILSSVIWKCDPIAGAWNWDRAIKARCVNVPAQTVAGGSVNVALDAVSSARMHTMLKFRDCAPRSHLTRIFTACLCPAYPQSMGARDFAAEESRRVPDGKSREVVSFTIPRPKLT